jgi:hypothetical protein
MTSTTREVLLYILRGYLFWGLFLQFYFTESWWSLLFWLAYLGIELLNWRKEHPEP